MKVLIDIKELMLQLETLNPDADFTGVKAYFFDLISSPSDSTPSSPRFVTGENTGTGGDHLVKKVVVTPSKEATTPINPAIAKLLNQPTQGSRPEPNFDKDDSKDDSDDGDLFDLAPEDSGRMDLKPTTGGKRHRGSKTRPEVDLKKLSAMDSRSAIDGLLGNHLSKSKDSNQFVSEGSEGDGSEGGDLELG